jgi:hypothetical protein
MFTNSEHKTGVINPYVLVELKLKKRINWKQISDPRKLIERVLNMPYEKLFDPKYGSPLYPDLDRNPTVAETHRIELPFDIIVEDAWIDPGDFFHESAELNDPVQGALGDCYLIAALSSVAWARPYVIAQRTRATGSGEQQFVDMVEFYKYGFPPEDGKAEKVEVNERLPLTSPGNMFIYARSSEVGEIWPAIYEKAFDDKLRIMANGVAGPTCSSAAGSPEVSETALIGSQFLQTAAVDGNEFRTKSLGTGNTGWVAPNGYKLVNYSSHANLTPTAEEACARYHRVVSAVNLMTTHNYVLPLTIKRAWFIHNATTGGQSIQVIGTSGTGVTIAADTKAWVYTDGTNFY